MKVTELRLREPLPLVRGQVARDLLETPNGMPQGGWKMLATNWGVRIEKTIQVKGKDVPVCRIVPWAMIKYAEIPPDAVAPAKGEK